MKKIKTFLLLCNILSLLTGCSSDYHSINNDVVLPTADDEVCYWEDSFQDYTHFCIYYYNQDSIHEFEEKEKFHEMTEDNCETAQSYIDDFISEVQGMDWIEKYDMEKILQAEPGDLFYLNIRHNDMPFESYDLYYVDMSECVLYFMHHNT